MNGKLLVERIEDIDCDGLFLFEYFIEFIKMNGCEEYCEEKVKSESLI